MGVPSLVDAGRGIAYDTLNIPGWMEFPLRKRLEDRYRIPAFVNNDANCFALSEAVDGAVITALNEVGDVEKAVESGADDFLTKPVAAGTLYDTLHKWLEKRGEPLG